MKFEDLHDYAARGYYLVPNEATAQWRDLIKGLHINKAAAICSSGEVGLIGLLPTVRQELVLVDHSYASLSVAMVKYALLDKYGAKETRRLLIGDDPKALKKAVDICIKQLPDKVRDAYSKNVQHRQSYEGNFVCQPLGYSTYYDLNPSPKGPLQTNTKLQREWESLPTRAVTKCATKLNKVKFVHGDLTDLAKLGQFDLLYLSNALDHGSRTGKSPIFKDVAACVKPGGYVILAHHRRSGDYYGVEAALKASDWEMVASVNTRVGSWNMNWDQSLFRIPVKQEVAA